MNSPGTEVFKLVPLDAFLKFLKISCFKGGTLKKFKEAQEATRCQIWSKGAPMNSPGPEVFLIGVTLDAFLKCLKSGALRGTLRDPGGN